MSRSTPGIRRHFVTVGTRRVHYRRAGTGPPLVMLHASPVSSQAMVERMTAFANDFTVIAPDTPGYGRSDPLDLPQPEISDYADALAETLEALGIRRAVLYGRHTGACIAMALAARSPGLVAAVWCDGYPVLDAAARARYLGDYLETVQPRWDGTHLLWYWFRYREQFIHWPWHDQRAETRADVDLPDVEALHAGTMDMLVPGPQYVTAYAAAFRFDSLAVLPRVNCPVFFAARPGDSLYRAIQALPALPGHMQVVGVPRESGPARAVEREVLGPHAAPLPSAPLPPPSDRGPDYLSTAFGELAIERGGAGQGPTWLLLPPAPGSTALLQLSGAAALPGRWVSIDLPGHGHSSPVTAGMQGLVDSAEAVEAAAAALGADEVVLYGSQTGAAVALELALRKRLQCLALCLDDLPVLSGEARARWAGRLAQDACPSAEGAHLLRVWHHQRNLSLWQPGELPGLATLRRDGPTLETAVLHRRVIELLHRPQAFAPGWRALLESDLAWRLEVLAAPLLLPSRSDALFGLADARLADRAAAGARVLALAADEHPVTAALNSYKTIR